MKLLLGLGGNTGGVPGAFREALETLAAADPVVGVLAVSSLYRSRPEGPPQADFWNQAALLELRGSPVELLVLCQGLEESAGRDRGAETRWGPRPLDLDLLMAPAAVHRGPRLVLPHPRFHRRAFALVPAAELVPHWLHPHLGRTVGELAARTLAADPSAVWPVDRRPSRPPRDP